MAKSPTRHDASMDFIGDLNEFNRTLAEILRPTFDASVSPYQTADGALVFRGPIVGHRDPRHIGTHVHVSLEEDVVAALDSAEPSRRQDMIQDLVANLGTRVRMQYDPNNIGEYALSVVGTMRTLNG